MKGTIISILAVVVALFVGFAVGQQLAKKADAASITKAAGNDLSQVQKTLLIDQLSLAIAANSEDIAKKILTDSMNKGVDLNALKIVAEKAKVAAPSDRGRQQNRQEEDPDKRYNVEIGKSYVKGKANAPVTIFEFSEFQCPFCSRGFATMNKIAEEYGDKVRFVFKSKLLPSHSKAPLAHNAALAAGDQGKFWEMHDKIFANQKEISRDKYLEWAKEIGLDIGKFTADMDNADKYKAFLDAEAKDADQVGVRGTPTFVVNGQKVRGAQPFEKFKEIIDEELKK